MHPRLFDRLLHKGPVEGFTPIRRNVGTFENRGGTIGWLATDDALAVVDTQFPDAADLCWAGLQTRTPRAAIDVLLNTHHHGDHTGGNGVFARHAARVVAHENVPGLQRQAAERRDPPVEQTYATTTFGTSWRTDLGSEVIRAIHYGPAHTGGDAVIHFEEADVAHMGDLVFNRRPPFIDRPGGASIQGWIDLLETVHAENTDATVFIFGHAGEGHGITGSRADLLAQRDFLSGLLEYVQTRIQAGASEEEVAQLDRLPDFPEYYRPDQPQGIPNCLRIAYQELSG